MTKTSNRLFFIFGFLFTAFALSFSSCLPAKAEDTVAFTPVKVMYLVRSAESPSGYKERISWTINSANDWDRFYSNLPNLPKDKTVDPDPLKNKAEDMIVLTRDDANKLTGFDIYLSSYGIMAIDRGANHSYYADKNKLRAFLEEEQKQHASFESFMNGEINAKSKGIVVTYNVNQNIPNPTWLVESSEAIRMYDSFFKALKPYDRYEMRWKSGYDKYDDLGNFILMLNYGNAPARVATITKSSIRLSNSFISTTFYQDTEDYYNFFKDQAREMINYNEKYKNQENNAIDKRQF